MITMTEMTYAESIAEYSAGQNPLQDKLMFMNSHLCALTPINYVKSRLGSEFSDLFFQRGVDFSTNSPQYAIRNDIDPRILSSILDVINRATTVGNTMNSQVLFFTLDERGVKYGTA